MASSSRAAATICALSCCTPLRTSFTYSSRLAGAGAAAGAAGDGGGAAAWAAATPVPAARAAAARAASTNRVTIELLLDGGTRGGALDVPLPGSEANAKRDRDVFRVARVVRGSDFRAPHVVIPRFDVELR